VWVEVGRCRGRGRGGKIGSSVFSRGGFGCGCMLGGWVVAGCLGAGLGGGRGGRLCRSAWCVRRAWDGDGAGERAYWCDFAC